MKRLHLIRHAKSAWDHRSIIDIERPLNKRGKNATKIMAPAIYDAGCRFETVYASPAVRAQETIKRIAAQLPDQSIEWKTDDDLYTFNADDLLNWCKTIPQDQDDVTIVGHNPAITNLVNRLSNTHILNVPTCGYIQLEISGAWADLDSVDVEMLTFSTPKMVGELTD